MLEDCVLLFFFFLICHSYNTLHLQTFAGLLEYIFWMRKSCQPTEAEQFLGEQLNQCMFSGIISSCSYHLHSVEILTIGII